MKNILWSLLFIPCLASAQYDDYKVDALVTPRTRPDTITVGGEGADIRGFTGRAIQLAIDALPARGGTVVMTPGTFLLKDAVHVRSDMTLTGTGDATVLKRVPGYTSKMVIPADYAELKVTVEDASGFEPGMSLQVWDGKWSSCWDVSTATITDVDGNTVYFDHYLIRDYHLEDTGRVSNAGSGVLAKHVENVVLSHFMVDGDKAHTPRTDGCNGGGIAILYAKNVLVDHVHVKDFNGEGITWQVTEDVTVQNCEVEGSANIGMHPGTGSPRTRILNNESHHNAKDGLFICWRVHHGVIKGNSFHDNGRYGICTGHKDTDDLFEDNHIYNNGSDGVNLRPGPVYNAPHRVVFVNNVIENNGQNGGGYGFSLYGKAEGVVIRDNVIRDTGGKTQKAAVFVAKGFPPFTMEGNRISGHPEGKVVRGK